MVSSAYILRRKARKKKAQTLEKLSLVGPYGGELIAADRGSIFFVNYQPTVERPVAIGNL
jgi:hypothetical protein